MAAIESPGVAVRTVLDAYGVRPVGFLDFEGDLDAAVPSEADLWRQVGVLGAGGSSALHRTVLDLGERLRAHIVAYNGHRTDAHIGTSGATAPGLVVNAIIRASGLPSTFRTYRDGWLQANAVAMEPEGASSGYPRNGFSQKNGTWLDGFVHALLHKAQEQEEKADAIADRRPNTFLRMLAAYQEIPLPPHSPPKDLDLWGPQAHAVTIQARSARRTMPLLSATDQRDQVTVGSAVRVGEPPHYVIGTVLDRPFGPHRSPLCVVKLPGDRPLLAPGRLAMPFPVIELECGEVTCAVQAERRLVATAAVAEVQRQYNGSTRPETEQDVRDLTHALAGWCGRTPADLQYRLAEATTQRTRYLAELVERVPELMHPGDLIPLRTAAQQPVSSIRALAVGENHRKPTRRPAPAGQSQDFPAALPAEPPTSRPGSGRTLGSQRRPGGHGRPPAL